MTPRLYEYLDLEQCPHCFIDKPSLLNKYSPFKTEDKVSGNERWWSVYVCMRCGGCVTASTEDPDGREVIEIFPEPRTISVDIPDKPRELLRQSLQSLQSPSGSILLSAAAVDAMLKDKGFKEGHLNLRIQQAVDAHLITNEMSQWAHEVRLQANSERHADEGASLPSQQEASRIFKFAEALAQFLFVLPAMVKNGRATEQKTPELQKKTALQKLRDSRPTL